MKTVPCPQGDKGLCTIPNRTAVVEDGVVSIRSRADVESTYPSLDLDRASLQPLMLPASEEGLIEAVDQDGAQVEQVVDSVANALLESNAGTAVVVNCSCGHYYMADA